MNRRGIESGTFLSFIFILPLIIIFSIIFFYISVAISPSKSEISSFPTGIQVAGKDSVIFEEVKINGKSFLIYEVFQDFQAGELRNNLLDLHFIKTLEKRYGEWVANGEQGTLQKNCIALSYSDKYEDLWASSRDSTSWERIGSSFAGIDRDGRSISGFSTIAPLISTKEEKREEIIYLNGKRFYLGHFDGDCGGSWNE